IACDTLFDELERGLAGPFFRERITDEERALIGAMVRGIAIEHPDPVDPPAVLRDPGDDYLVDLARDANAEAIVTGDRDLLDHTGLEPPAITAREACRELGLLND
ncbi:MAG: putative toxin-antitoxin system toxin component, PIN family, partial [Actinobacteria bacterium]|nr:putative toxin-antitoxin system toxin component, PIN family [Actinomycetota bacterium]